MSYILGALKKAEKERKSDKPLDFDNWDKQEWSTPSESSAGSYLLVYVSGAVLVLMLALLCWLAYKVVIKPEPVYVPEANHQAAETTQQVAPAKVIDVSEEEVQTVYTEPEDNLAPASSVVSQPVREASQPEPVQSVQPEPASRPALPSFSGHIYFSNNKSLSRVFSGADAYREGQEVGGYLVERIENRGFWVSFDGEEFFIRLEN